MNAPTLLPHAAATRRRDVTGPIGPLRIWANAEAVTAVEFHPFAELAGAHHADQTHRADQTRPVSHGGPAAMPTSGPVESLEEGDPAAERLLTATEEQLAEYFAGEREHFELPLAPRGTDFQRRVWAELARIPYGETRSYGQVAHALGLVPGASRAVGLANGRNPVPVVVPCHRVIGADGTLTGYAGGLERKRVLLDLERDALF